MKFTYVMGTSFTKFGLFFHKVFSIINKLFSPLRETLCVGRVKLFAEGSQLFTHAVFQLVFVRKTASSEFILHGAIKIDVRGC